MKEIDGADIDRIPGVRLQAGDKFSFRCYAGISCFNRCCRNLNLFLYPYDVVRLKNALATTSDAFLDTHVDIVLRPHNFFPDVVLRMSENMEKTCPFLADNGCCVYADRPDTCRSFPIEQGLLHDADTQKDTTVHFFRPPDFCLGQHETCEWTLDAWADDQQAGKYHEMTMRWAELKRMFHHNPWGREGAQGPKAKMTFMATYNIDRFREFVFHSSFLRRFRVTAATLEKVYVSDADLLTFGFEWVKVFLWGIQSELIRPKV